MGNLLLGLNIIFGADPTDNESRQYFNETLQKIAPDRDDIATWFDLLEVDDFVSFGGAA